MSPPWSMAWNRPGAFSDSDVALDDLYRAVILDHYRNPRHRAEVTSADHRAEGVNPLCGDEVTVELRFTDGRVEEVSVRGHGCSISQSSGSMMAEALTGRSPQEIRDLASRFRSLFDETEISPEDVDNLGELAALQGVRRYPARVKCATLPWATLDQALDSHGAE